MEEFNKITNKYSEEYFSKSFQNLENLNEFALVFYQDVAEIYDAITRVKNIERNPSGYNLNDAPIIGLLVRVWKLLKEIIHYYEKNNAEIIGILERPLIESSVIASYLMNNDDRVIEDYRKCSYKNRLRILRALEEGETFFETKAGNRLVKSITQKMDFENLTPNDFTLQKKNQWKLQGKSFFDIFSEVENKELYSSTYGMMSETIHGSWNESLDWCLSKNIDGTFSPYPFHFPADIRFVTPTLSYTNKAYCLWLKRIDAYDANFRELLDWVERVNKTLYLAFDDIFDE